jgi:uncharacterized protein YlxW (UPF0749 family)
MSGSSDSHEALDAYEERVADKAVAKVKWGTVQRLSFFALILLLGFFVIATFNNSREVKDQNATISRLVTQAQAERAQAARKIDLLTAQIDRLNRQVRELGGQPSIAPTRP